VQQADRIRPLHIEELIMLNVERVVAAQKTQLGTAFGAGATVFEGIEKLARLNLQAGRATLDECAEACRAMLKITDPQQFVALQSAALEPATAKWAGYAGQVYAIVAATGAELRQIAEQSATEAQNNIASALEATLKDSPAGSEQATAFVKSAFATVNAAFEKLQSTYRQMGEVADAQVETLTAATQRSTPRSKRAA
jgi:phasin family protein